MARAPRQKATPATAVLAAAGVAFQVHTYTHDASADSFGLEAAEKLGVAAERVFKTLVIRCEEAGPATSVRHGVAVVPVCEQLDLKRAALAWGAKRVHLAAPATAERLTGYVLGAISPVGPRRELAVTIDASALSVETTLFVSGGRRGFELELELSGLLAATGARIAPLT
ncbi:aminoacyl-tRNA deacylase [Zhihengliuella flava]|uniref:Cys-tRNA(Pro)/Cys-tRNA(Cys) deacylase n=1 Tax=Zhihengliuella flava TaxID=1285193 RepID=A0A931DF58_9MICC|nr:aminoacyl-tRNA deacylase [Zhihengliuella flava]MBG6085710.1 Cys-tRNA(Pro)/Cys-tRNA(Cys) deacylase [Zhihengliuella flava]